VIGKKPPTTFFNQSRMFGPLKRGSSAEGGQQTGPTWELARLLATACLDRAHSRGRFHAIERPIEPRVHMPLFASILMDSKTPTCVGEPVQCQRPSGERTRAPCLLVVRPSIGVARATSAFRTTSLFDRISVGHRIDTVVLVRVARICLHSIKMIKANLVDF
jgi:hypothetical protein